MPTMALQGAPLRSTDRGEHDVQVSRRRGDDAQHLGGGLLTLLGGREHLAELLMLALLAARSSARSCSTVAASSPITPLRRPPPAHGRWCPPPSGRRRDGTPSPPPPRRQGGAAPARGGGGPGGGGAARRGSRPLSSQPRSGVSALTGPEAAGTGTRVEGRSALTRGTGSPLAPRCGPGRRRRRRCRAPGREPRCFIRRKVERGVGDVLGPAQAVKLARSRRDGLVPRVVEARAHVAEQIALTRMFFGASSRPDCARTPPGHHGRWRRRCSRQGARDTTPRS